MTPAKLPPDAPPGVTRRRLDTPAGEAWADLHLPASRPIGVLALGHGAGGTMSAPDLVSVTGACTAAGLAVVGITQPYRVAGKGVASTTTLDTAWCAVIEALHGEPVLRGPRRAPVPWLFGGRSSGARVACRTASAAAGLGVRVAGVLALAFPLHPPGRPDRTRQPELDGAGVPVLVIQGSRDPFGMPEPDREAQRMVEIIEGADHGLKREVPRIGQLGAAFALSAIGAPAGGARSAPSRIPGDDRAKSPRR